MLGSSSLERLQALWFAPKRFESTALYERLGLLLVKQYAPTGGDLVNRRYGVTMLQRYNRLRVYAAIRRMASRQLRQV